MKRIRFLMVGGFLGAGKTTTLAWLAKHYTAEGLRVAIVTNDQAYDLVDTQTLRNQGFDVGEVPGACFCCRFNDLVDTMQGLESAHQPDIILAEPVGSCTDLVATVVEPLRQMFGERFELGPLAVLIKPEHGLKILTAASRRGFSPQAEYIFLKQLEEADILVLNKVDKLTDSQLEDLVAAVQHKYPEKPLVQISVRQLQGVESLPRILAKTPAARQRFMELDYQTYAEGEAALGWLNCQVRLESSSGQPLALDEVVQGLVDTLATELRGAELEPAHLKVLGQSGVNSAVANLVAGDDDAELSIASQTSAAELELTVNARVAAEPDRLRELVESAVENVAAEHSATAKIDGMQCFQPAPPEPTHRVTG